jgi:hypothetical protein
MKRLFSIVVCVAVFISIGSSADVGAGDFESLIDGYSSTNLPVIKLPWLSKEAYLENALPKNNRIFSKKTDFRIENLNVYQRFKPEVELFFYKDQLCEVIYFSGRSPDICLENFSACGDLGKRLHLVIKRYGPGKSGSDRMVIWPAGYEVERKRLWSVGNIKIGLYEISSSATSILLAKHLHLNNAIFAAQQKYRQKKAKALSD